MALRWSIMRLFVRSSRSAKRSATAIDGLGGARFALRLLTRADALREIRATLRTRHAEYSRALFRDTGSRNHRSGRGRADCGRIATQDTVDDRVWHRAWLEHQHAARKEPARRLGDD